MKMTKKYDGLDDAFNVETEIVSAEKESIEVAKKLERQKSDVDKDYEYTRGNLYSIIEKGQEAINGILELAQESEMPRACLLYTSPSPRDLSTSRMPSSA